MDDSVKNLVIENLSASYDVNGNNFQVFESVSFEAYPGKILVLFGSNGCGKSTLLRVIATLKEPDTGKIYFPWSNSEDHFIGILPQNFRDSFFNWASLAYNIHLTLPNPIKNWRKHQETILRIKKEFDLNLDLRLRPESCSGGMLQQAAIIRAFAGNPKVLLVDEPFSALDVNVSGRVRRAFVRLVRERNIIAIVVLHDLEDIVDVSDAVFVIPNLPFTTNNNVNKHQARIIENVNARDNEEFKGESFVEIAEKVLKTRGKNS